MGGLNYDTYDEKMNKILKCGKNGTIEVIRQTDMYVLIACVSLAGIILTVMVGISCIHLYKYLRKSCRQRARQPTYGIEITDVPTETETTEEITEVPTETETTEEITEVPTETETTEEPITQELEQDTHSVDVSMDDVNGNDDVEYRKKTEKEDTTNRVSSGYVVKWKTSAIIEGASNDSSVTIYDGNMTAKSTESKQGFRRGVSTVNISSKTNGDDTVDNYDDSTKKDSIAEDFQDIQIVK